MAAMANPHFGKLADVWKHAVLAEALDRERPARFAETHAGSGAYPLTGDAERRYGILRFLQLAPHDPVLARSKYRALADRYAQADPAVYPGSALLAMDVLGDRCAYLLCELDPGSAADLRRQAARLGLRHCEVAEADGMLTTSQWLESRSGAGTPALVHIDPFDPRARAPGGWSALELAARVSGRGTRLAFWYGYDQPAEQAWAFRELAARTSAPLWCGDLMIADADGAGWPGDLGRATTPGTGFGMIAANLRPGTVTACADLGHALAGAYDGLPLPGGSPGSLVFTSRRR